MRTALSKEAIVQAALDVLDDQGMDGVTVRAVAQRLGVKAPALYWHVKNKQELLDEMATEIWRRATEEMLTLAAQPNWRERLRAYATIVRRALLSHRDGAKAFSGTYLTDSALLQQQESMLAEMIDAGFTLENAIRAYSLIYSFTVGFSIEEQAAIESSDDRYSLGRRAQRLDARHPLTLESGPLIFGDAAARFTDLVEVLVESIARMRAA